MISSNTQSIKPTLLVSQGLLSWTDHYCTIHRNLNARRIEVDDADLGGDVAEDAEVDAVVEGGVAEEVGGVGLEEIDAIDGDGGDDLSGAVGLLEEAGDGGSAEGDAAVHDGEAGLAVLDADLVGVDGGEEEAYGEGERGGGGGIGCDAHVLHPHLLQIELRLLGLHRQDYHKHHCQH